METKNNSYDGVQYRSFLADNWYKGCVVLLSGFFVIFLLCVMLFDISFTTSAYIAGSLSLICSVAAITQHQRFEIDASHIHYRSYTWIFGLHFGQWLPLPAVVGVSARSHSQAHFVSLEDDSAPFSGSRFIPPGMKPGFWATEQKWQVLLSLSQSSAKIVAAYVPKEKALTIANSLGNLLNVVVTIE